MSRVTVVVAATLIVSCGEFADRELSACHPNCNPDSGVTTRDGGSGSNSDAGDRDAGSDVDSGIERDGGARDGGMDHDGGERDGGAPALLALDDLWRTSHAITFGWDPTRVGANVQSYVFRYGVTESEVDGGGGMTWDADDDPNLGFFESPHTGGRVSRSTIRNLSPNTTYYARLYVHRTSGETVAVAVGDLATIPERETVIEIFREELPMAAIRTQFGVPTDTPRARGGTRALWIETSGGPTEASIRELGVEIPAMFPDRFEAAFVEFFIDLDFAGAPAAMPFIGVSLAGQGAMNTYAYEYVALPGHQGFQQIQIPLRVFRRNDTALTAAALGEFIESFGITGTRPPMTGLIVDDVVIRF